jgi:hypothetical protein
VELLEVGVFRVRIRPLRNEASVEQAFCGLQRLQGPSLGACLIVDLVGSPAHGLVGRLNLFSGAGILSRLRGVLPGSACGREALRRSYGRLLAC